MKRNISSKQFENMIAECVNQVLSESRRPQKAKNKRVSMNESQMQNYVRNIINEELENEGATGRIKGGIKGAFQGAMGLFKQHRLNQQNKNSDNPQKKVAYNNRKDNWSKFKKTIANQAADSDRNQELTKLVDTLEKLQLNNYFDQRPDIYEDVNNLINKLEYFMRYEEGQTQGQYKRNFGVNHPDKENKQQQGGSGMNKNWRDNVGDYKLGRY